MDEELYREMNVEDDFYMGNRDNNTSDNYQGIIQTIVGLIVITVIAFFIS